MTTNPQAAFLAASYGEQKRIHAAAALLNSAAAFFANESAHGMRGAVKWVEGADGALVIFTRGEYREQLLRAVDGSDDPTYQFAAAEKLEISDEAIKAAALAAGAAKFYPDAQSKKPWGEEAFLVTGGFLQRFVKAIGAAFLPDEDTIKNASRYVWLRENATRSGVNIDIGAGVEISDTLDAAVDDAMCLSIPRVKEGGKS